MRRHRLFLVVLLAAGLIAPPASADTRPVAGEEGFAVASWLFEHHPKPKKPKKGKKAKRKKGKRAVKLVGYLAFVLEQRPISGPTIFSDAFVGRGPCRRDADGVMCEIVDGGVFQLRDGEFGVDPLQTARLEIHRRGFDCSLLWTGTGMPTPAFTGTFGGGPGYSYEAHGVGAARGASISGAIAGRTLSDEGLTSPAAFASAAYAGYEVEEEAAAILLRLPDVTWSIPAGVTR